jgi:hypothetical protein
MTKKSASTIGVERFAAKDSESETVDSRTQRRRCSRRRLLTAPEEGDAVEACESSTVCSR